MAKKLMWWDKDCNTQVDAGRVRTVNVYERCAGFHGAGSKPYVEVWVWFSKDEGVNMGTFDTMDEARAFVDALPKE